MLAIFDDDIERNIGLISVCKTDAVSWYLFSSHYTLYFVCASNDFRTLHIDFASMFARYLIWAFLRLYRSHWRSHNRLHAGYRYVYALQRCGPFTSPLEALRRRREAPLSSNYYISMGAASATLWEPQSTYPHPRWPTTADPYYSKVEPLWIRPSKSIDLPRRISSISRGGVRHIN